MSMYPSDPADAEAAMREGVAAEQARRQHYHDHPEGDLREAESTLQPEVGEQVSAT